MGILDIFKKKEKNVTQQEQQPEQKLVLRYSSGERADVIFGDDVVIDGKKLKQAEVCYTLDESKEDSLFIAKKILLEPHMTVIDNKEVEDTYNYYTSLMASGKTGAVKGFFQRQQLDMRKIMNNPIYAGILEVYENGAYRREDTEFANAYRAKCEREELAKKQERESEKSETLADKLASEVKTNDEIAANNDFWKAYEEEQTIYGPNDPRSKLVGKQTNGLEDR